MKNGERVNYKSRELIEMIMQAATDDADDGVDDDDHHLLLLLLHESVHD